MPKENKTAYAILGLLNHEPMTGYDIKKRIKKVLSHFWDAGFGQIYPALKKLEQEGFVTKRVEFAENGPNRKVYTITEQGKELLRGWLGTPVEKENVKYEILLKLYFGSEIPSRQNQSNIEDLRRRAQENLNLLALFEGELRSSLDESIDHLYYLLTVLFGKHVYQAYVSWADEAVSMLEAQREHNNQESR